MGRRTETQRNHGRSQQPRREDLRAAGAGTYMHSKRDRDAVTNSLRGSGASQHPQGGSASSRPGAELGSGRTPLGSGVLRLRAPPPSSRRGWRSSLQSQAPGAMR